MDVEVTHEPEHKRFVVKSERGESRLFYVRAGEGVVDFCSTYVEPSARGHGVGEWIVRAALEWARSEGLKVIPSCWFVGTVVRRHPEYRALLEG